MNYLKHPCCMEAKMLQAFGETADVECAGYILEDGTLVNLSYDGIIRTEDHRIVGQFFSKAQGSEAMYRFMQRGNIRVKCSGSFYGFEYIKEPTKAQAAVITKAMYYAYRNGIPFRVEKTVIRKTKGYDQFYPLTTSVFWEEVAA